MYKRRVLAKEDLQIAPVFLPPIFPTFFCLCVVSCRSILYYTEIKPLLLLLCRWGCKNKCKTRELADKNKVQMSVVTRKIKISER